MIYSVVGRQSLTKYPLNPDCKSANSIQLIRVVNGENAPSTRETMNLLYSIARNPLTLYLRFILEATRNGFKYKDFQQGYMSRVVDCEIEPHVRIFPETSISNCRIGRFSYVAAQTNITHADVGRFCSIGLGCRIGLGMHPARGFVSTSPVFFSTA